MVDGRRDLLRRLLWEVCRAVTWGSDGQPEERLSRALASYRLSIDEVSGIELAAWVTDEVELAIWVRVAEPFSAKLERALVAALERDGSLVAGMILADYASLRAACESANAERPVRR